MVGLLFLKGRIMLEKHFFISSLFLSSFVLDLTLPPVSSSRAYTTSSLLDGIAICWMHFESHISIPCEHFLVHQQIHNDAVMLKLQRGFQLQRGNANSYHYPTETSKYRYPIFAIGETLYFYSLLVKLGYEMEVARLQPRFSNRSHYSESCGFVSSMIPAVQIVNNLVLSKIISSFPICSIILYFLSIHRFFP